MSEDSGPVSEISRTVSDGSKPVYESGRSTHESSVGSLSGNSARESSVAPMKSGTVSEISAGTVTSDRSLRRERLAPAPPRIPVGEDNTETPVVWQPVHDLDPLIAELSAIQPIAPEDVGDAPLPQEGEPGGPLVAEDDAAEINEPRSEIAPTDHGLPLTDHQY